MHIGPAIRLAAAIALLFAGGFAFMGVAAEAPRARHLASYEWSMDRKWFGGWSGLELSADGRRMTAITDRGRILTARIERQDGRIVAIHPERSRWLKSSSGKKLTGRIWDSEGLAVDDDGTVFVSFEGLARVVRFRTPAARSVVLDRHPGFADMSRNKALEALAIDGAGRLYAVPEKVSGGKVKVYVIDGTSLSQPFSLDGGDGFLPVGADIGPDGRFYLLERSWSVVGFRSRLRRWDMDEGVPKNEQLLMRSHVGKHGNLEGVAVWTDEQGRTRITMVADDNFKNFQRTEIAEYVVTE